jgi:hypothetical protein
MQLRPGRLVTFASMIDGIGAACAYAIILGMIATALAPLFAPLLRP